MVASMISLDPNQRKSAENYLSDFRGPKCFPLYFSSFVHQYLHSITDSLNQAFDPDSRMGRISQDFDKIAVSLGFFNENIDTQSRVTLTQQIKKNVNGPQTLNVVDHLSLEILLNIPNFPSRIVPGNKKGDEGSLIFLSFICSCIRNLALPSSKLFAIDIFLALGLHLPDNYKLERVVPYLMSLVHDPVGIVRAMAIRSLTQLLATVEVVPLHDAEIFPEYIFPELTQGIDQNKFEQQRGGRKVEQRGLAEDKELIVRTTYARCLASLAESSFRFLEYSQWLKNKTQEVDDDENEKTRALDSYDVHLNRLHEYVKEELIQLISDPDPIVNRCVLSDITTLYVFLGREKTDDALLYIGSIINKHDWQLQYEFNFWKDIKKKDKNSLKLN